MKTLWIALTALVCFTGTAQAHQIWLEQAEGQGAVIRFGEFGENLREVSPGLLDKFVKPTAVLLSAQGEKSAEGSNTGNGFTLPFKAGTGETIVAEEANYPFYSTKQGDKSLTNWYRPAARLITSFAAQSPKLVLDLVPTGQPGEFKLYFKGQPLSKTKVTLVTQSGWSKEERTNEQGLVTFDMPWKGTYIAEVSHNDRVPGERQGVSGVEKYDAASLVTTVSYVKADGLAPLPAGPAAEPYKAK
jgi:uncharacterized GH25 family protein